MCMVREPEWGVGFTQEGIQARARTRFTVEVRLSEGQEAGGGSPSAPVVNLPPVEVHLGGLGYSGGGGLFRVFRERGGDFSGAPPASRVCPSGLFSSDRCRAGGKVAGVCL